MPRTAIARGFDFFGAAALVALIAISASAQSERVIYTFTGASDGGYPGAGLTADSKGNLYGTTEGGGANYAGTVFELSPGSNGTWSEQVLHSFIFNDIDGADPYGGVVFDSKGNLYGATAFGGNVGDGTVFELSPASNGVWTEKILYSFAGGSGGQNPYGGVVLDSTGNIYGIMQAGGVHQAGIVFELVPGSNGLWTEKTLYSFADENDGAPLFQSTLILDGTGNLYGVGRGGPHDYGIVFELAHGSNGGWAEKILYAFTGGSAGGFPFGGLVFDGVGNLYGVSLYSVFELTPGSNGTWTEKPLYSFLGGADGEGPEAPLIFDKAGNLYGTTNSGGHHRGTVFELAPGSNGVWTEKILHRFLADGVDGVSPNFSLVLDAGGNLYGTTIAGGSANQGVVFGIKP